MTAPAVAAVHRVSRAGVDGTAVSVSELGSRPADLDDIRAGLREALEDGATPIEAVEAVRGRVAPDDDAVAFLLALGWRALANDENVRIRKGQGDDEPDGPPAVPLRDPKGHYTNRTKGDVLSRVRLVVGGINKTLVEMTLADIVVLRDRAEMQAAGWQSQYDAFGRTAAILKKAGVDRVGDLPADQLARVRESMEAVSAW